jgi:hypothetical protein
MEAVEAEPMQAGQQSMPSIEIVSKVLPKSRTILQNVGLPTSKPSSRSAVSSQVRSYRLNLRLRSKNLRNLSKNLHNLSKRWLAKRMKLTI